MNNRDRLGREVRVGDRGVLVDCPGLSVTVTGVHACQCASQCKACFIRVEAANPSARRTFLAKYAPQFFEVDVASLISRDFSKSKGSLYGVDERKA